MFVIATPLATRGIYKKWSEITHLDKQIYKKLDSEDRCNLFLSKIQVPQLRDVINDKKLKVVFTDGAALRNGKANALTSIGIYIPFNNTEISEKLEFKTNNEAELFAVKKALSMFDEPIVIVTDSTYVIYIMWEVPNVTFVHINSHTGLKDWYSLGNEKADQLANQALGIDPKKLKHRIGGELVKLKKVDNDFLKESKDDTIKEYLKALEYKK